MIVPKDDKLRRIYDIPCTNFLYETVFHIDTRINISYCLIKSSLCFSYFFSPLTLCLILACPVLRIDFVNIFIATILNFLSHTNAVSRTFRTVLTLPVTGYLCSHYVISPIGFIQAMRIDSWTGYGLTSCLSQYRLIPSK